MLEFSESEVVSYGIICCRIQSPPIPLEGVFGSNLLWLILVIIFPLRGQRGDICKHGII